MAHPKRKISKQRKRKRRTHYKATAPQVHVCKNTGLPHLWHRAYKDDMGNTFYKGKMIIEGKKVETTE